MGIVSERPKWSIVLATAPLWPIAWLIGFASLARVKLGVWPRYDQPDPQDLHWPFLDIPPLLMFLLVPVALLVLLIIVSRRWIAGHRDWTTILVAIGSFTVLVLWLRLDPGGFIEWWLD